MSVLAHDKRAEYIGEVKPPALFAKNYRNPAKNIDDCVTYILNYVQKSGCNGFTDGEIYGQKG